MARLSKIPPKLRDEVATKSAEGWSCAKIKNWLLEEHQTSISAKQIQELLNKIGKERSEASKAAYAQAAHESANQDIDILKDKISKFNKRVDQALASNNLDDIKISGDLLLKFMDRRIKLSGIDKEDNSNNDKETLLENILDKLGK